MANNIAVNFSEINQASLFLFKGKTQQIIFIAISIIASLLGTALIICAVIFNIPLLCLGLLCLFAIVLLSFFLLSTLSNFITPFELSSNITGQFTPCTTILSDLSLAINKKTTPQEAAKVLQQIRNEINKKFANHNLPVIDCPKRNISFPILIPEKNKTTAIVSFIKLSSSTVIKANITERSWESATVPFLPKGAVSAGYWEYKTTEHQKQFPFVRLLLQTQAISITDSFNPTIFMKTLKATYLNIFAACEAEHIKILQIPSCGYDLTSKSLNSNSQINAHILNKIAFLEAIFSFNFFSIKKIYFVTE